MDKMKVVGRVKSPDGETCCEVGLHAGVAFYRVRYGRHWVVGWSRLGFVTDRGVLGRHLNLITSFTHERNELWETQWGEERLIRDHYRELELNFWEERVERVVSRDLEGVEVAEEREAEGVDFTLRVRVFDTGVGFRYEVGGVKLVDGDDFVEAVSTNLSNKGESTAKNVEMNSTKVAILDELTEFNVSAESTAWWIPAYQPDRYEYNYVHTGVRDLGKLELVEQGPAGMNWDLSGAAHTPMTVITPEGDYLAIHEAALYDYGSMTVRNVCEKVKSKHNEVSVSGDEVDVSVSSVKMGLEYLQNNIQNEAKNHEKSGNTDALSDDSEDIFEKKVNSVATDTQVSVKNDEKMELFTESTLKADITPLSNGVKAYINLPWKTPWRIMMLAKNALDLTQNRIMLNLNEPPKSDFSWVKPLKFIGIWWGLYVGEWTWAPGERHGATTEHMRDYIDTAVRLKMGGVLAEGWNNGWDGDWLESGRTADYLTSQPDYDLPEVAQYAAERRVELVMHHETVGFIDNYNRQLKDAYAMCEQYGIHYIKSGYANAWMTTGGLEELTGVSGVDMRRRRMRREFHHSQIGVRHYQKTVELAAKHRICLDIHEPIKGTGIERTWPNLLTREGARGQEYESGALHPSHATIIPFTRMLAGGMDYTSGILDVNNGVRHINTTIARQLAYFVTIFSAMQMAADRPKVYEEWYPDLSKFITEVPVSWERTVPLCGEVGEYYAVARQERVELGGKVDLGGDEVDFDYDVGDVDAALAEWRVGAGAWYVGGVNNEDVRVMKVDLGFLGEGEWNAEVYRDFRGEENGKEVEVGMVGEGAADFRMGTRERYVVEKLRVRKGEEVEIWMGSGGGFAMRIYR